MNMSGRLIMTCYYFQSSMTIKFNVCSGSQNGHIGPIDCNCLEEKNKAVIHFTIYLTKEK